MTTNSNSNAVAELAAALKATMNEASTVGAKPKNPNAFKHSEAKVEYAGKKIVLPDDPRRMSLSEGKEWLARLEAQEEEIIGVHEVIQAHPWDGAVAFMKAMQQAYGWASPSPTPGFFGPQPPTMVSIETGHDSTATIFWGAFKIPGLPDTILSCGVDESSGRPLFSIGGRTKRKYLEAIHGLADLAREIIKTDSIYRGKALRLLVDEHGMLDMQQPPKFLDLSRVNPAELVYSDSLMTQIETNLWTPIEHTALCREHKVPLKRGVLLEGPYGTGKTLCATVTATKCEENGWTFVTVGRVTALESALQFAAAYQPCVVFVEDIDREMAGSRTREMDDILNTIDGIISKGAEIMVVLTSNDVKNINKAMLRPGRLDAILHIDAPDAKAAEKLIRVYARDRISDTTDLSDAGQALAGRIPAVIREAVERAKLYAIKNRPGSDFSLSGTDIKEAAEGMAYHLDLLNGKKADEPSTGDKLLSALMEGMNNHLVNGQTDGFAKKFKELSKQVHDLHDHTF